MPPIHVALIGLSASATTSWAADAHLPYLLSSLGRRKYEIIALLNSSVAAAEAAKQHFNLLPSVKAYGDPSAVARDNNIDLVVCCTRVDAHFATIEPSLRAGKAVFVEWPLVENLARAIELTDDKPLANSLIGLQGRVSPVTLRIKSILASGTIGKVLSSQVSSYGTLLPRDALPENVAYFAERRIGGNPIVIENGHSLDWIHEVLGEFEEFDSRMQIQRPVVKILNAEGKEKRAVATDVPDWFSIQGTLKSREGKGGVVEGAVLAHTFRHGTPFKGKPGLAWSINGEKGELLITMGENYLLLNDPVSIQFHDHATDEVTNLEWDWQDWQKELPLKARGVGELYERYAEWIGNGKGHVKEGREWPTLDDAIVRMRQFDTGFRQYDKAG